MNIQEKIEKFVNSFIISDEKTQMNSLLYLIDVSGFDQSSHDTLEYLFKQNIPGFIDKLKIVRGLSSMENAELKEVVEKYEFNMRE